MHNTYRSIRQLERFLFRGVPEHPEPAYPGDSNASVEVRLTGKTQASEKALDATEKDFELFATVIYDAKDVKVIYKDGRSVASKD